MVLQHGFFTLPDKDYKNTKVNDIAILKMFICNPQMAIMLPLYIRFWTG